MTTGLTKDKQLMIVRLLGGEMVMGEVWHNEDYEVRIHRPIRIVVMPGNPAAQAGTPAAQPTVGFAPWFEFVTDEEFDLNPGLILTMGTPQKDFVEQYNQIFSKIIQPKSGVIVP